MMAIVKRMTQTDNALQGSAIVNLFIVQNIIARNVRLSALIILNAVLPNSVILDHVFANRAIRETLTGHVLISIVIRIATVGIIFTIIIVTVHGVRASVITITIWIP